MNALEFYRALLASAGIVENPDNPYVMVVKEHPDIPVTVEGKSLCLPTDEVLSKYNDVVDEVQVFHPASENVLGKDALIFNFLKRLYRTALSTNFELLANDIAAFSLNPELSEKANKAQRKYISAQVDEKTIENLGSLFNKIDPNGERKIIDITVLRAQQVDGETYSRVAYVHFPLLEEIEKDSMKPFGIKMRKKDTMFLVEVYKHLFGVEDTKDSPKEVTNHLHAPNFYVLTKTFYKLLKRQYDVSNAFGKKIKGLDVTPLDWYESLDRLDVFRGTLPSFPGNDGEVVASERKTLKERAPVRVTPLGTVKQLKPKEEVAKPRSYAELREQGRNLIQEHNDRHSENRYSRHDRPRFRRGDEIDLSGYDDEAMASESRSDRRRDYDDDDRYARRDRRGYASDRRGYADDRRTPRYASGRGYYR